jgi:hypothetical protein
MVCFFMTINVRREGEGRWDRRDEGEGEEGEGRRGGSNDETQ